MEWSDEQVGELRHLFGQGQTPGTIAGVIGRTRNSVIGKLTRIGLHADTNRPALAHKPKAARAARGGVVAQALADRAVRKKAEAALAPEAPIAAPAEPAGKLLLELVAGDCRFIVADDPARFCAAPVFAPGASWCAWHGRMCYQPARPAPYYSPAKPRPEGLPAPLAAIL